MSRKTMKVEVEELTEVDVEGIALVKRGANRIPFRIIKREDGEDQSMKFNIADLFKSAPQEPEVPTLVGVIVNKAASVDGYRAAIEGAGLQILDSHDIADTETHFLKFAEGLDDADADVMKINEDIALVITGLSKALADIPDTNSFMENLNKTQFFPGMGMAMSVLQDTVRNIAFTEDSNDDAVVLLEKCLDDFKEFVVGLAKAAPDSVAMFEKMEVAPVEESITDDGDEEDEETEMPEAAVVEKAEEVDDAEAKDEVEKAEAEADAEIAEETDSEIEEETVDPMVEVLEKLSKLDTLNQAIDAMHQEVREQGDRLGVLEKAQTDTASRVKKAEEDLRGTIPGGGEHSTDGRPTDSGEPSGGMFDSVLPFGQMR